MREGYQVKHMTLDPVLAIESSLLLVCYFLLVLLHIRITKILVTYFVYFGFVNLGAVGD
jgi:hypothetical protein